MRCLKGHHPIGDTPILHLNHDYWMKGFLVFPWSYDDFFFGTLATFGFRFLFEERQN